MYSLQRRFFNLIAIDAYWRNFGSPLIETTSDFHFFTAVYQPIDCDFVAMTVEHVVRLRNHHRL